MPLTEKGSEIKRAMEGQYGKEKGEQVFYASKNKGTITGVDDLASSNILRGTSAFGMESDCADQPPPSQISNLVEARDQAAYGPGAVTIEGIKERNKKFWAPDWAKKGDR